MATPKRIARIKIEERTFSASGIEQGSGKNVIEHPSGNPLRVDFLFTRDSRIVNDADIDSVTASVLAKGKTGDSFADATSDGYDTTVAIADWNGKTKQNAFVEFDGPQLELEVDAAGFRDYDVVIYFGDYTIGWFTLRIYRDDVPTGQLPVQAGNIIPEGAVYDGSGEYLLNVVEGTYYIVAFGAHDDSIDNDVDNITESLTVFKAAGATILLHGDAGQSVSAVIRPNPIATTQFLQALIEDLGVSPLQVHEENLVADEIDHTVAGLGLSTTPKVIAQVIAPDGGDFISCMLVAGSETADGFKVRFSAPIPNPATNYKLRAILKI